MGFFDKLLGRTPPPVGFSQKRWETGSDTDRAANSWSYLERVGDALELEDRKIAPQPSTTTLRGTVRGFPIEIVVGNRGDLREMVIRIGDTNVPAIDIGYDPEADDPFTSFTYGSAEEEARFDALPRELRVRMMDTIQQRRVRSFRSRTTQLELVMHDSPVDVLDPIAMLVDPLRLAIDVITARGQVPPGKESTVPRYEETKEPSPWVRPLVQSIASKVTGAKIVEKLADADIDVRWTEDGVPVRIRVDYQYNLLDLEVRADGVTGDIHVEYDQDVVPERGEDGDDPWSEDDVTVFLAKYLYLQDTPAVTKAHAALLHSLGPALLGELVKTLEKNKLGFYLDDQVATTDTIANNEPIKDGGTEAVRIAKLLARVAKALPRGAVPPGPESVRCKSCDGRYFGAASCVHCGQR